MSSGKNAYVHCNGIFNAWGVRSEPSVATRQPLDPSCASESATPVAESLTTCVSQIRHQNKPRSFDDIVGRTSRSSSRTLVSGPWRVRCAPRFDWHSRRRNIMHVNRLLLLRQLPAVPR
jgi:hypothetical protein